jgi:hypothetical protein
VAFFRLMGTVREELVLRNAEDFQHLQENGIGRYCDEGTRQWQEMAAANVLMGRDANADQLRDHYFSFSDEVITFIREAVAEPSRLWRLPG